VKWQGQPELEFSLHIRRIHLFTAQMENSRPDASSVCCNHVEHTYNLVVCCRWLQWIRHVNMGPCAVWMSTDHHLHLHRAVHALCRCIIVWWWWFLL
jgi:hypothetical protein